MVVSIKDAISVKDEPLTCGSRILENFVAPYHATVVQRLLDADAILVGKTNMDEFAMGSSTENSAFGRVKLPQDETRVPGGSSGGSAVAVKAGMSTTSLGTDTGGSIRQPAALTGVVGVKPTYGRVSRYGLVAFASSFDQIGPITTTGEDAAILLEVLAGADPRDSTCSTLPVPRYSEEIEKDVRSLRIGVPRDVLGEGVEASVLDAFDGAVRTLEKL